MTFSPGPSALPMRVLLSDGKSDKCTVWSFIPPHSARALSRLLRLNKVQGGLESMVASEIGLGDHAYVARREFA